MVSRKALKLNEILRNAPKAVDMDLPHQREAGEHAEDMTSEPEGVTYEEAYDVDCLCATPPTGTANRQSFTFTAADTSSPRPTPAASSPATSPTPPGLEHSSRATTSRPNAPSPPRWKTPRPTTGGY